jgi:hypothetical protein
MAMSANSEWLDQFRGRERRCGHAGAVEAVLWLAPFTMTPRRFPAPWRAEPIPGGYVVRDANGQALGK